MTSMIAILIAAVPGLTEVIPLDAFKSNYAAIRARATFAYEFRVGDRSDLPDGDKRFDPHPRLGGAIRLAADGRWECDGLAEHYVIKVKDGKPPTEAGPGQATMALFSCEVLFDDEIMAYRHLLGTNHVEVMLSDMSPVPLAGPLAWWRLGQPFPRALRADYPGVKASRKAGKRGGYITRDEIYRREYQGQYQGVWSQREISYDPSFGYLPRYIRSIQRGLNGVASVKETYLIDAKPVPSGGFVPIEWYDLAYMVKNFDRDYPSYDETTVLKPTGPVSIGHLRVEDLSRLDKTPALDQLADVKMIFAPGGGVPLKGDDKALTIGQLKTKLGSKLKSRLRSELPDIDAGRAASQPQQVSYWPHVLSVGAGVVGLFILKGRRRSHLAVLIAAIGMAGCHAPIEPVVALSASFTRTKLLYEPGRPALSMTMTVRNVGNQTLKLLAHDSCSVVPPCGPLSGVLRSRGVVMHTRSRRRWTSRSPG